MNKTDVPILILAFNRPDTTFKVFNAIREIKPKKLFIAVDGPRPGNEMDEINVKKVREILSNVDWPCKVKKIFREKNLGSLNSTVGAITWFFENVEYGAIVEDDCLPSSDFFKFCAELLEKYKDDERIMHIGGNNFQRGWTRDKYSYYFSYYPYMWGWATWARAWKKFDRTMGAYPELKNKGYFRDIYPNKLEETYIRRLIEGTYSGKNPTGWDNNWIFTLLTNNGLSIAPNKNLVKNIGFVENSVRTKPIDSFLSIDTQEMEFPLKHPPFIFRDRKTDERYIRWIYRTKLRKYFLMKTGLYKLFSKNKKN